MSYMVADTSPHPSRHLIADVRSFTTDLARELGGEPTFQEQNRDATTIALSGTPAGDLHLHVTGNPYSPTKADRIVVSARVPNVPLGDYPRASGHGMDKYRMPEITVSAERDIQAVARDVTRRVITPATEPAAAIREYAREQREHRDSLSARMQEMKALYGDEITFVESQRDIYTCPFQWYQNKGNSAGGNFYLSGRLNADGTIYVDRVSSLNMEMFAKIIKMVKAP